MAKAVRSLYRSERCMMINLHAASMTPSGICSSSDSRFEKPKFYDSSALQARRIWRAAADSR
jgi:hypothetical protein